MDREVQARQDRACAHHDIGYGPGIAIGKQPGVNVQHRLGIVGAIAYPALRAPFLLHRPFAVHAGRLPPVALEGSERHRVARSLRRLSGNPGILHKRLKRHACPSLERKSLVAAGGVVRGQVQSRATLDVRADHRKPSGIADLADLAFRRVIRLVQARPIALVGHEHVRLAALHHAPEARIVRFGECPFGTAALDGYRPFALCAAGRQADLRANVNTFLFAIRTRYGQPLPAERIAVLDLLARPFLRRRVILETHGLFRIDAAVRHENDLPEIGGFEVRIDKPRFTCEAVDYRHDGEA